MPPRAAQHALSLAAASEGATWRQAVCVAAKPPSMLRTLQKLAEEYSRRAPACLDNEGEGVERRREIS